MTSKDVPKFLSDGIYGFKGLLNPLYLKLNGKRHIWNISLSLEYNL